MKQEKIVKIIILLAIIIVGFISVKYAFQEKLPFNIPSMSLPPMPSIDLGVADYENKNLGINFSYPNKILELSELETNVNLKSKYFTNADMSGIPGNEKIHYFGFDFSLKKSSVFEAIKQEMPYVMEMIFPNGKLEDFQDSEGFTQKITIAEKESYTILQGIEGVNIQYIFIPKNDNETILMQFMYIGDFLNPEISETEQKDIFEFIASTLEFI